MCGHLIICSVYHFDMFIYQDIHLSVWSINLHKFAGLAPFINVPSWFELCRLRWWICNFLECHLIDYTATICKDRRVYVINNTVKWNIIELSWQFQDRTTMTQGLIWCISGMMGFTPWIQGSFWNCDCYQHYGITTWWIVMELSGYGHKEQLTRLFHAWITHLMCSN